VNLSFEGRVAVVTGDSSRVEPSTALGWIDEMQQP